MSDNDSEFFTSQPKAKSEWAKNQDEIQAAIDSLTKKLKNPELAHEDRQQMQWQLDDLRSQLVVKKKEKGFNDGTDKLNARMDQLNANNKEQQQLMEEYMRRHVNRN